MKEKWTTPKTVIEEFTPSNYCAICWAVGCKVPWTGTPAYNDDKHPIQIGGKDSGGAVHQYDHCGNSQNQFIVEGANGKIEMKEINTDGLGDLVCHVTSPKTFTWEAIQAQGGLVKWETYASGNRVWKHYGYAVKTSTTSNAS